MKANVDGADRSLRFLVGIALIEAGTMGLDAPVMQYALLAAGSAIVLSSLLRFCLLYPLLGVSTCSK